MSSHFEDDFAASPHVASGGPISFIEKKWGKETTKGLRPLEARGDDMALSRMKGSRLRRMPDCRVTKRHAVKQRPLYSTAGRQQYAPLNTFYSGSDA